MALLSFGDVLRTRAQDRPDADAFFFWGEAGSRAHLTYGDLSSAAEAAAATIRQAVPPGGRTVLLYPPGRDYVSALFGCFYAGVTAVPAYPPDPSRLKRTLPRLLATIHDAQPAAILTTQGFADVTRSILVDGGAAPVPIVATDAERGLDPPQPAAVAPDDVAILQYTSGSTAAPRGVMLTHRNLLDNSEFIYRAFGHSRDARGVIWLPPYHDMGLIGGLLQPVYGAFPCTIMSPLTFLRQPVEWLRAITSFHGTTSGGPNFAFDLCARRITPSEIEELDLSSWDVAFNGAERIQSTTLESFAASFAAAGFRPHAFFPCYGLAEGTLMVTAHRKLTGARTLDAAGDATERVVSSGTPNPDHRIAIVDPVAHRELPEREVGEVWVRGPSVAAGYWGRDDDTRETFGARLTDTNEGPFLRTGDLAFLDRGELFVTGRLKDLLIIEGRNYYPDDVELACEEAATGVRRHCGAAFAITHAGREHVVVVYELTRGFAGDLDETVRELRQAVGRRVGVRLDGVVLVEPGGVPKTSSGKVQRSLCRTELLDGGLSVLAEWFSDELSAVREPLPT